MSRRWIVNRLAGPTGCVAACLIAVAYALVSLSPYRWNPPRRTHNGVQQSERGAVRFAAPGKIEISAAPSWLRQCIEQNQIDVRLRVRSFSARQHGPARIFTISHDPTLRNLTVEQTRSLLVIRLRTPDSDPNGNPAYIVDDVFSTDDWHDLNVAVRDKELVVTTDGRRVISRRLPDRPLSNWDSSFRLALGNELTGDRPWLGEIAEATVRVDGLIIDCLRPGMLQAPPSYWAGLNVRTWEILRTVNRRSGVIQDAILNFLCFVPFGFVLAIVRGERGSFTFALLTCLFVSLCVECLQIGFEERFPSVVDWCLNSSGAAVGALMGRRLVVSVA